MQSRSRTDRQAAEGCDSRAEECTTSAAAGEDTAEFVENGEMSDEHTQHYNPIPQVWFVISAQVQCTFNWLS